MRPVENTGEGQAANKSDAEIDICQLISSFSSSQVFRLDYLYNAPSVFFPD
jgi:hypothetical protein